MKQLNGYDIDGTLTVGLKPEEPFVVISGRGIDVLYQTCDDLRRMGIDRIPYLRRNTYVPVTDDDVGIHKSEVINGLGVTRFYEDNVNQAKVIEKNCPNCEVILIVEAK